MRLKEIRRERKLSVEDLAVAVGVKPRTIRSWEQGQREPSIHDLIVLADTLNCSIDNLVGRKKKERG